MVRGISNNKLKVLVTLGLGAGYLVIIGREVLKGDKVSAISNSILLPANLVWLWLISDDSDGSAHK